MAKMKEHNVIKEIKELDKSLKYASYIQKALLPSDSDLKKLFLRIRDNELYHIDIFNDLLQEEEK